MPRIVAKRALEAKDRTPAKRAKESGDAEYAGGGASPADSAAAARMRRQALLRSVVGVLDSAEGLSMSSRDMFRRMADGALLPSDERHCFQDAVVEMLRKVFAGVEAGLARSADGAAAAIEAAQADEEVHREAVRQVSAALADHEEKMKQATAQFYSDNLAMQVARVAWDVAAKAREVEEPAYRDSVALRDELQAGLRDHYTPLLTCSVAMSAQRHVTALAALLRRVPINESISAAFPHAAWKPAASRSAFDQVILERLKTELEVHIQKLDGTIADAAAGLEVRQRQKDTAAETFESSRHRHKESCTALRNAELEQRACEAEKGRREEEVQALAVAQERMGSGMEAAKRNLADFRAGPCNALETLASWKGKPFEALMACSAPTPGTPSGLVPTPARAGA